MTRIYLLFAPPYPHRFLRWRRMDGEGWIIGIWKLRVFVYRNENRNERITGTE